MTRPILPVLMLATTLFIAGCESAEDKAESYYQSALSLLEEGDEERAILELRNVFEYDGFHQEARQLYADTLLQRGEESEAYSQYLRLIEQYPDTAPVRMTLAEIAIGRNDWDEVERHGEAALELAPDDPRAKSLGAAIAFRQALLAEDAEGQTEALAQAREVLDVLPDNLVARRIVIATLLNGRTPTAALPEINAVLEIYPELLEFHVAKFRILSQAGMEAEAGAQLEEMYALFPDDEDVRTTLIRWYVAQGDNENTLTLLRDLAGEDTATPEGHLTVVQFLQTAEGVGAAKAELDRLIETNEGAANADLYRAMRASLEFSEDNQDGAITEMQTILESADDSDQTRRIKITLARMLIETGDQVGARALVEEVLGEDSSNVEALKIRAIWMIEEDDPDAAIADLRSALNQAPRDATVLTLMAQAHQRSGQPELAGERLALATEVSNNSPETSLRYARFLIAEGRPEAAQSVLTAARRANPGNLEVLTMLAQMMLEQKNWQALSSIRQTLLTINTVDSVNLANGLQTAILQAQGRTDESLQYLQEQLEDSDNQSSAVVTVVLAQLRAGRSEEARDYLDQALSENPDDPGLRLLSGSMLAMEEDYDGAEALYREVLAEYPGTQSPVRLLYRLLAAQGRGDEARDVLDAGIAANPSEQLLWIKAGILEEEGDIDGVIAIYEDLYSRDTNDTIMANNLASTIATYKDDDESLTRAFNIARRLRGIDNVPAFQDTIGWIDSRRGNYDDAIAALEPAAAGLPNDPFVQFHLGMTYAALERKEAAIEALTRALELWGDANPEQATMARSTLIELQAAE